MPQKVKRFDRAVRRPLYILDGDLERAVADFVNHNIHQRYQESLNNLTPADVDFERGERIRERRVTSSTAPSSNVGDSPSTMGCNLSSFKRSTVSKNLTTDKHKQWPNDPTTDKPMRDQYVGDITDVIKFALLRTLAGSNHSLGIGWYYVPGDDGRPDGRHLEWRHNEAWRNLHLKLCVGLEEVLQDRRVERLERSQIWPSNTRFFSEPVPRPLNREEWVQRQSVALSEAGLVFLDPDNGIGRHPTRKHVIMSEVGMLRREQRTIVVIGFPGRHMPHDEQLNLLHQRLVGEVCAKAVVTLRTNVTLPRGGGVGGAVPRARWFTIIDGSAELVGRMTAFKDRLNRIANVRAM